MSAEPAYQAVVDRLFALKPEGKVYGIDRMRFLTAELGHPERKFPCVHVAGTNGKGSVAAMIEAILHAAGWRTGLYTSPHLVHLGERVQVDRVRLTEDEIAGYAEEIGRAGTKPGADPALAPTFFEYLTGMAFLQFARQACDIAVIEVGLGGRLDATNVVVPEVSVITSIAMDHCEILGESIEKIAAEKAGIIKPGRPVVLGRVPPAAERVIRAIAGERGAPLLSVAQEFGDDVETYPSTNLEGDYQRWNAATATLVGRLLGARWRLTPEVIARGLARVDWPGRWQRTTVGGRLLILDASHNPEGAAVLDSNLARLTRETGRAPVVVTGVLGMVRARPLIEAIARHAAEIHLVVPQQPRACTQAELESLVPVGFGGVLRRSDLATLFPAPGVCAAGGPRDVVVLTGSIYLLGEVLRRLQDA
ncbi:MAG: hypothetical protein RIR76_1713 [Verrucomicrobiota bacterium]|jgi:dihydrofolate synthase/folylpolyglutamate synthase